jgi:hypothetical protein
MAAKWYYRPQSHATDDHDQKHLLSPSMSSPGFSPGHPSPAFSPEHPLPLKPQHLVAHEQDSTYHYGPRLEDYDSLKDASNEDAVRDKPQLPF